MSSLCLPIGSRRPAQTVRLDDLMVTVAGITAENMRLRRDNDELRRQLQMQTRALECLRQEHTKTQAVLHQVSVERRHYHKQCRRQAKLLERTVSPQPPSAPSPPAAPVPVSTNPVPSPPSPPAPPPLRRVYDDDTESEENRFVSAHAVKATKM